MAESESRSENQHIYTSLPDELITLVAAADLYGIGRQRIRNWLVRNHIQEKGRLLGSARGGGFTVVARHDVEDMLATRRPGRPKLSARR